MQNIYVSDLDGTLLNSQAQLTAFARESLNGLLAQGLLFTVASARSIYSMQEILHGLQLRLPVIEFNGAFITDFASGAHLQVNAIASETAHCLLRRLQEAKQHPLISTWDGVRSHLYYTVANNGGLQWYVRDRQQAGDPRLQRIANGEEALREQIICFTIIGEESDLRRFEREFAEQFPQQVELHLMENQYSPGWFWLTVHDARATKAQALEALLLQLGYEADRLTVFGDHINDIKMFALAGRSIAVANAQQALKPFASQLIGSNDEDSVVRFLQADFNI